MLTGPQKNTLSNLIRDSFNPASFSQLLMYRLDKKMADYASPANNFRDQVFEVLQFADGEVWEEELMLALAAERPKSKELIKFVASFQIKQEDYYREIPARQIDGTALEALVSNIPNLDPEVFITDMLQVKKCVCRVEVNLASGKTSFGTGFLVGPDLLITNYHVVEKAIEKPAEVSSVNCKFDYFIRPDQSINTGIDVELADNPFLAYRKYGPLDVNGSASINVVWPPDMLDYALLKLKRKIGDEAFGLNADKVIVDAEKENVRGWIKPVANATQFLTAGGHIMILQHAKSAPVKVAIGFNSVLAVDPQFMRVRYNVNTMGGSSGSPCFNEKFQWTALHNMGDPDFQPLYNQGIPADKIVADLQTKGINL